MTSIRRFHKNKKLGASDSITHDTEIVESCLLPDVINKYLNISRDVPPLEASTINNLQSKLGVLPDEFVVHVEDVYNKII
jgi:hypothetical protein